MSKLLYNAVAFFKAKSLPDFIGRVSIEIVADERRKPNSRVVC